MVSPVYHPRHELPGCMWSSSVGMAKRYTVARDANAGLGCLTDQRRVALPLSN